MKRTVTIIRQCWVGMKACRPGDVIEVEDKDFQSLLQSQRIVPPEFEAAMKLAEPAKRPTPRPIAEAVAKTEEPVEEPVPKKKKRGRPRKKV